MEKLRGEKISCENSAYISPTLRKTSRDVNALMISFSIVAHFLTSLSLLALFSLLFFCGSVCRLPA